MDSPLDWPIGLAPGGNTASRPMIGYRASL